MEFFINLVKEDNYSLESLVKLTSGYYKFWGEDLSQNKELVIKLSDYLKAIQTDGMVNILQEILNSKQKERL